PMTSPTLPAPARSHPFTSRPAITPTTIAPSSVEASPKRRPASTPAKATPAATPTPTVIPMSYQSPIPNRSVYGLGMLFQAPDHVHAECARPGAVDDPMVEGDGDVSHLAHHDL